MSNTTTNIPIASNVDDASNVPDSNVPDSNVPDSSNVPVTWRYGDPEKHQRFVHDAFKSVNILEPCDKKKSWLAVYYAAITEMRKMQRISHKPKNPRFREYVRSDGWQKLHKTIMNGYHSDKFAHLGEFSFTTDYLQTMVDAIIQYLVLEARDWLAKLFGIEYQNLMVGNNRGFERELIRDFGQLIDEIDL